MSSCMCSTGLLLHMSSATIDTNDHGFGQQFKTFVTNTLVGDIIERHVDILVNVMLYVDLWIL